MLGLASLAPRLEGRTWSFPLSALALGYVAFAAPLGLAPPDPREHNVWAVHLTEIGVIISLMGVGLKIGRRPHWRTWSPTWRLLAISMPLTIAGVALLGWWVVGLTPAAAVLLGAALAPTDPVLASDVQVKGPEDNIAEGRQPNPAEESTTTNATEQTSPPDDEDELRFTLTSEAGLNDALAFPFTYLALTMLTAEAGPIAWLGEWLLIDVAYRILMGVVGGLAVGWALALVLLRLPVESEREKMQVGVSALAGTLLIYGVTECLGGYGFLAVFIGGLMIRHYENTHQSHRSLHIFSEQLEQLVMTGVMIALGGAIAGGLLAPLTWEGALLGVVVIFVVRPVAGMIGLMGENRLAPRDRLIASFFGIRGVGCLYYLAYGLEEGDFMQGQLLWATCAFTVLLSIVVHGLSGASVMAFRDRRGRVPA
ncbi:cation:proton antiporter [Botrimarina mediterranea]|uniref:cation:proton antiporter n=1 Tax=Botrimarina mediterranea TaxID=2528022 RepID=UPI003AF32356